jgi:hypothetical protein
MLSGRLAKPNTNPTERTTREEYHYRLTERDALAKLYADWMRHGFYNADAAVG